MAVVLLIEDHPVVRRGLRDLVEQAGASVEAEAGTGELGIESLRSHRSRFDLIVLDLSLPDMSGLEVLKTIRSEEESRLPILITANDREGAVFVDRAFRAGADGYVTKYCACAEYVAAVRELLAGEEYLADDLRSPLLFRLAPAREERSPEDRLNQLSDRELELLEFLGAGLTRDEVADRMNVSVKTIETYRSRIKTKLHLESSLQVTRLAVQWIEGV